MLTTETRIQVVMSNEGQVLALAGNAGREHAGEIARAIVDGTMNAMIRMEGREATASFAFLVADRVAGGVRAPTDFRVVADFGQLLGGPQLPVPRTTTPTPVRVPLTEATLTSEAEEVARALQEAATDNIPKFFVERPGRPLQTNWWLVVCAGLMGFILGVGLTLVMALVHG
jgi:hypothetical protein